MSWVCNMMMIFILCHVFLICCWYLTTFSYVHYVCFMPCIHNMTEICLLPAVDIRLCHKCIICCWYLFLFSKDNYMMISIPCLCKPVVYYMIFSMPYHVFITCHWCLLHADVNYMILMSIPCHVFIICCWYLLKAMRFYIMMWNTAKCSSVHLSDFKHENNTFFSKITIQ